VDRHLFIWRWAGRRSAGTTTTSTWSDPTRTEAAEREAGVTRPRFELFRVDGGWQEWRFVASNNRVVAIGSDRMANIALARADLAALYRTLPGAVSALYEDPAGRWRWDLRSSGTAVARSSRWSHSRVVCESTLAQFLYDVPHAHVVDTGKLVRRVIDLRRTSGEPPVVDRIRIPGRGWFGRAR
jgi:uncharacterized protein YegP (UPF0339 family)